MTSDTLGVGPAPFDSGGRKGRLCLLAVLMILAPLTVRASVVVPRGVTAASFPPEGEGPVPVPPAERGLRTRVAAEPVEVPGITMDLEGACFDHEGRLIFSDVQGGRVLRQGRDGRIETVGKLVGLHPGGMSFRPDGRIAIAAADDRGGGAIVLLSPASGALEVIVPQSAGYVPNDVAFDAAGGFYFTDARGNAGDPRGGVYYVAPDGSAPRPVFEHLAVANGVALSPDGKRLWVGEFGAGRLHRIDLDGAVRPKPFGATIAYHFIGPAPDSMRIDAAGNVYVALYQQGRIMVFAPSGVPIGQILLEGREKGRNLNVTSLAIRPGSRDLYAVASDGDGKHAAILHASSFGPGIDPDGSKTGRDARR